MYFNFPSLSISIAENAAVSSKNGAYSLDGFIKMQYNECLINGNKKG